MRKKATALRPYYELRVTGAIQLRAFTAQMNLTGWRRGRRRRWAGAREEGARAVAGWVAATSAEARAGAGWGRVRAAAASGGGEGGNGERRRRVRAGTSFSTLKRKSQMTSSPVVVSIKRALSYHFVNEDAKTSMLLKRAAILNTSPVRSRKTLNDTQRCNSNEFILKEGFLWHVGSCTHVFTILNIENSIGQLPIDFERYDLTLSFVEDFEEVNLTLCKLTQTLNAFPAVIKRNFPDTVFTLRGKQFPLKSTERLNILPKNTHVIAGLPIEYRKIDRKYEDLLEFDEETLSELVYGKVYFSNRLFQVVLLEDDSGKQTNLVFLYSSRLSEAPVLSKCTNLLASSVTRDTTALLGDKVYIFTPLKEFLNTPLQGFLLTRLRLLHKALESASFATHCDILRDRYMNRPDIFQIFVAKRDSSGHVSVLYDFIELKKESEVGVASLEDVIEATGLSREDLLKSGRKCGCPEWTLGFHYCHALDRERSKRSNSPGSDNDDAMKKEGEERLRELREKHEEREQAEAAAAAAAAREREVGVKKERERRRDEGAEKHVRPHYQPSAKAPKKNEQREPSIEETLKKAEFQEGREERTEMWERNREREREAARRRRADELHEKIKQIQMKRALPELEEQYAFKHTSDLAEWSGNAKPLSKVKELPECGGRRADSDDDFDTESVATSAMTLFKSRHARQRQVERGVTDHEIKSAIKHGIVTRFSSGKSISRDRGLCIVHAEKHIITAYREEEGNVRGKERTR